MDRILGTSIYISFFIFLLSYAIFVPRPELPEWNSGDYIPPTSTEMATRPVAAIETSDGPMVVLNSEMFPVPSKYAEGLLSEEIKILEFRRDQLLEEIKKTQTELIQLQQVKLDQIETITRVLERNAARERFLAILFGFLTGLVIEVLSKNKRIHAFFVEST
ncbi:MAG: hypothetical protein Q7J69_06705 [Candidatus Omnitrophota bacterium]|nr:hypothetical protein [Candidatus Omnitrophota bacterium]